MPVMKLAGNVKMIIMENIFLPINYFLTKEEGEAVTFPSVLSHVRHI